MKYADILNVLSEWMSPETLSFDSLLQEIEILNDEPVDPVQLGEELDYLLMADVISGDDRGYTLSDKWWDLEGLEREDWLNDCGRPSLVDPLPLSNDNPRNSTRDRYDWEANFCTNFEIPLGTGFNHRPGKIALVSGRYLNPRLDIVMPWKIRERIRTAARSWQQTESGAAFIRSCGGDFSLTDLGTEIHPDFNAALIDAGIFGLQIREWEVEQGWNYEDDINL